MEWALLLLSIPVFYIIGLITFIRWLVSLGRHTESAEGPSSATIAAELRLRAHTHKGKVREELLAVADSLAGRAGPAADTDTATTRYEPGVPSPTHIHATAPASASDTPEPAKSTSWASRDLTASLHSLDNINLMLFLGAFLIVVSAGIFVGYNFETLSGVFKTVFLALFTAAFYFTGLILYLNAPKLRPAGSTFTGIGLVLLPLVGLAAYNFTSAHDHGSTVWFVTSLITLAAYVATLLATRQTYIAYLMAFTSLSLFESGISLFNAPVYWFGWGGALMALILLGISRWTGWWKEAATSLAFTANILVPLSLIFSIAEISENGSAQLGVTFAIAGVFYAYMAGRDHAKPQGWVYWLASLVSLPAALGVGLWDSTTPGGIGSVLVAVAVFYLALGWLTRDKLTAHWQRLLGVVAGLLPFVAAVLQYDQPWLLLGALSAAAVINGVFAAYQRQSGLAMLAIMATVTLPLVLLRDVLNPVAGWGWVAAAYLVLTIGMYYWREFMRGWPESGDVVGMSGYLLSLLGALIAAGVSGHLALMLAGLAAAAALYWLAVHENRSELIYVASAVKYIAASQIVPLTDWPHEAYAMVIIVVGSLSYLLGYTMEHQARGQALRYSAIMATLFGAVFAVSGDALAPIASLALGGGLLYTEARRQSNRAVEEAAIAILILAYNWLLGYYNVSQTQAYTLPWAGYFAFLAYRRRDTHETRDLFTAVALAALTLPIAGQALGDNGQLYGLELIFIALGLAIGGSTTSYRLVMWWGVATLVCEVLYQMRDFLFALPKYLISAFLGLALLAVAIVLLQRRRN